MARGFDISSAKTSLKLEQGQGEFSFTVSNKLGHAVNTVQAQAKTEGQTKAEWLIVVPPRREKFAADGNEQFTVKVAVPAGTPPGTYTFSLVVSNFDKPNEEYAVGPTVSFEVPPPLRQPPNGPRWWIWVVIGGVVLVAGGVGAWWFLHGPKLHDPCEPAKSECRDNLACAKQTLADGGTSTGTVCLYNAGSACDSVADCLSGLCIKPTFPDGGTASKAICLSKEGEPCASNEDCTTRYCEEGTFVCLQRWGKDCSSAECPQGQKCKTLEGNKICLLPPGTVCTKHIQCSSLWCLDTKKCSRDDGRCTTENDCRVPFFTCANGICLRPNGQPCAADEDCRSGFCNQKVCVDDHRCDNVHCRDFEFCSRGQCFRRHFPFGDVVVQPHPSFELREMLLLVRDGGS